MKTLYQTAKAQIQTLNNVDPELPWLLTLDLVVAVIAVGYCMAVMA